MHKKWKILIAEDDNNIGQKISADLKAIARCKLVHNGEEALSSFKKALQAKRPYDCILLDVTMPKKDGFTILREIRAIEEQKSASKETKIIMITAYRDSLMENYNMGWDDFITKPIDSEKLLGHINKLLG